MESDEIEALLDKYFDGATSITEENRIKDYFASQNVAPELAQYKPLFQYFVAEQRLEITRTLIPSKSRFYKTRWISIAASIVTLFGMGIAYFNYENAPENNDLGTYDNPEIAFRETQKALALLSTQVNTGVRSVRYIREYENSKNLIFKN